MKTIVRIAFSIIAVTGIIAGVSHIQAGCVTCTEETSRPLCDVNCPRRQCKMCNTKNCSSCNNDLATLANEKDEMGDMDISEIGSAQDKLDAEQAAQAASVVQ